VGIQAAAVKKHLDLCQTAATAQAQGQAYEDLVAYLFDEVPGLRVERDLTSPLKTEQVDIAIGNPEGGAGIQLLPNVILVECKDWDRPVDSSTLGYFINTLANRGVSCGILVAAQGVTGDPDKRSAAYGLGPAASARGIRVLVITTDDILALTCSEDLVQLLEGRYLRAIASGALGFPDH
jgi:hypothetical protein